MKSFWKIRLWGLFSAAGFLACAATVLGFFASGSWFCEGFSHFRVHYLVALLVLALLLLVAKHRRAALLYLVFALVNLSCVYPIFLLKERISPLEFPFGTHRAVLMNIHSELGDPERVMEVLREEKPEILVLEEVTDTWMKALTSLTNPLPHVIAVPREDNFGIALFSQYPFVMQETLELGEAGVPSIHASIKVDGCVLELLATHPLPPFGGVYARYRNEQLDRVSEYAQGRAPCLLLGDLNMAPWSPYFKRFLERSGLRDSERGFGYQASWPAHLSWAGIPLDHCLHSADIAIRGRRIGPHVGSDHRPLIVDFTLRDPAVQAK